ncbi:MAG: signal peptidase I [Bergeyella sp.]|nr:signal peptidase I [Bergeyella sp.]
MNYFLVYSGYVGVLSILMGCSTWKFYKKMGYRPWVGFFPFYNYYVVLKETENPKWWVIFSYFPIVGPIMMSAFHLFLMGRFGKKSFLQKLLTVLLPFIYMAKENYTGELNVQNPEKLYWEGKKDEGKPKETLIGSFTFAIVFATIIHTFLTQPFGIPTGSMERTLLVGDFLFVNKLNYGYRMPMRPLGIPFLQNTLMDTGEKGNPKDDPKSYVEAVKLPYFRFPGWERPKRNDIVVFNYPEDSVNIAIDRKDSYVKRCVAIAGDTLEFRGGDLYINGKPEKKMPDAEVQHAYYVETEQLFDMQSIFGEYGFLPETYVGEQEGIHIYRFRGLTPELVKKFQDFPGVLSVTQEVKPRGEKDISYYLDHKRSIEEGRYVYSDKINYSATIFPYNKNWNSDWYGPLRVPKKGDVINITAENLPLYSRLIREYEGNVLEDKNGVIWINGKPARSYRVKYDYYMMIGDNRDASLDSRYFGFVPETHIVGKPMFTWLSLQGVFKDSDSDEQAPFKIRWSRMFKQANSGEVEKTSYWWVAVILLVLFFGGESILGFFKKDKKS